MVGCLGSRVEGGAAVVAAGHDVLVRGAELARGFYDEVVGPELERSWPGVRYAAGRVGGGSDVLGLDDWVSRDHDWGLRLTILVEGDGPPPAQLADGLERALPAAYRGHPTRFAVTGDAVVRHRVEVTTVEAFVTSHIGLPDPLAMTSLDWLALTGQAALQVTAGPVFHDTTAGLARARACLAGYPDQVRRHVLAAGWWRMAQELPLVGRSGQVGDDAGSRAMAGRLAGAALHMACVVAGVWAPYPKWLGVTVSGLEEVRDVVAPLSEALAAVEWQGRQEALGRALDTLYRAQHEAGLPTADPVPPVRPFFERPFLGIADEVVAVLRDSVIDPTLRALPVGVGGIEQWCDGIAIVTDAQRRRATVRAVATVSGCGECPADAAVRPWSTAQKA
jgi:hypothetical protein